MARYMVRVMVPELPRNGSLPGIFRAMAVGACEVDVDLSATYETETMEQAAERAANYVELGNARCSAPQVRGAGERM
jgi:hypothetical protein